MNNLKDKIKIEIPKREETQKEEKEIETNKTIKETTPMATTDITNAHLYEALLLNRHETANIKAQKNGIEKNINDGIAEIKEHIINVDKKLNKKTLLFVYTILAICFFGFGYSVSENKEHLKPFAKQFINLGGEVAKKAVTHGIGD